MRDYYLKIPGIVFLALMLSSLIFVFPK